MTTEISYFNEGSVLADCPDGALLCKREDFCGKHDGYWNSRVLSFVPSPEFSDGTPAASYEGIKPTEAEPIPAEIYDLN